MIRHPIVRLLQLALAVVMALLGALVHARPDAPVPGLTFALSVVGETEREDGSWAGVDLIAEPAARAERFQLNVRPVQTARLLVDELAPDGEHRVYPPLGERGVLEAGKSYALPGPRAFYERDGAVRLRVTLEPREGAATPMPLATPTGGVARRTHRLSDGSAQGVSEVLYRGERGAMLELSLPNSK